MVDQHLGKTIPPSVDLDRAMAIEGFLKVLMSSHLKANPVVRQSGGQRRRTVARFYRCIHAGYYREAVEAAAKVGVDRQHMEAVFTLLEYNG